MTNCGCGKCKDKAPCGKYWCECECGMMEEELLQ